MRAVGAHTDIIIHFSFKDCSLCLANEKCSASTCQLFGPSTARLYKKGERGGGWGWGGGGGGEGGSFVQLLLWTRYFKVKYQLCHKRKLLDDNE